MTYMTVVEGNNADNTMSEHKKEAIKMKAQYLAQAYQIAIEEMPFKTWNDCCKEAINCLATVLQNLMSTLKDFEAQETMLQLKAMEMGISMNCTPKCHCKHAGEGIKYAWACTKIHYQQQPLKDKRGKENFCQTVRKCFSREVVTTEQVRLFLQ
jgi:hypothetical protein